MSARRAMEVSSAGMEISSFTPERYPPVVGRYTGPAGYSPDHGDLWNGRIFQPGDLVRGTYDDWVSRGILKPLEVKQ